MIKKIFISALCLSLLLSGCGTSQTTESASEPESEVNSKTETEVESEPAVEETAKELSPWDVSIIDKDFTIGDLTIQLPSSWDYDEKENELSLYPFGKEDVNKGFLMVQIMENHFKNQIDDENKDEKIGELLNKMYGGNEYHSNITTTDGIISCVSKGIMPTKHGDMDAMLYYAFGEENLYNVMYIIIDGISDEQETLFNAIINTIKINEEDNTSNDSSEADDIKVTTLLSKDYTLSNNDEINISIIVPENAKCPSISITLVTEDLVAAKAAVLSWDDICENLKKTNANNLDSTCFVKYKGSINIFTYLTESDFKSILGTNLDGTTVSDSFPDWWDIDNDAKNLLKISDLKEEINNDVNDVISEMVNN